jgi:glutamine cyclotransferase
VYDRATFRRLRQFRYPGEGWGLASDGHHLIMSDGSATLRFWDPQNFTEVKRLEVRDQGHPVPNLNELEVVEGEIFANIWTTDRGARISPADGHVLGWIDLSGLLTRAERTHTDVLNGIAYDSEGHRLFVTGKWWPRLFEIEIVPKR